MMRNLWVLCGCAVLLVLGGLWWERQLELGAEAPSQLSWVNSSSPITLVEDLETTTTSPREAQFGISMGDQMSDMSREELEGALEHIREMGFTWVRFDADWSRIGQKGSTSMDWSALDRTVDQVLAHHLTPLVILTYTPSWARMDTCTAQFTCAPQDASDFAYFAKQAGERYLGRVRYWEIWNEPNIVTFWKPVPDASRYAELLQSSAEALRAVSPDMFIVFGGLSPLDSKQGSVPPVQFLESAYRHGVKGAFDAVGVHPYAYPYRADREVRWNMWMQLSSTSPSIRSVMSQFGNTTTPIWITEYGAPTGGSGRMATLSQSFYVGVDHVSESYQADMASTFIDLVESDPSFGPAFWYTYQDLGNRDDHEDHFGLLRIDGSRKPASDVFSDRVVASSTP